MDIEKFKHHHPDVVEAAISAYQTCKQDLSKVKRVLSKKYKDPTDNDPIKAEIMSYINGSLEELIGINKSLDDTISSVVANVISEQFQSMMQAVYGANSTIPTPAAPPAAPPAAAPPPISTALTAPTPLPTLLMRKSSGKARKRHRQDQEELNSDSEVMLLSDDPNDPNDEIRKFMERELVKENGNGSNPSRLIYGIFTNLPKEWIEHLIKIWEPPKLTFQTQTAYNKQRLQDIQQYKTFKKSHGLSDAYKAWVKKQNWVAERQSGGDHGNKQQATNFLYQALASWGKDGTKFRVNRANKT